MTPKANVTLVLTESGADLLVDGKKVVWNGMPMRQPDVPVFPKLDDAESVPLSVKIVGGVPLLMLPDGRYVGDQLKLTVDWNDATPFFKAECSMIVPCEKTREWVERSGE